VCLISICALTQQQGKLIGLDLANLLVIGNRELSPHAHSPAWVQNCTQNALQSRETEVEESWADNILESIVCGEVITLAPLSIGIHMGAYYCEDWVTELAWFWQDGGGTVRRTWAGESTMPDHFLERIPV
jgi:hypothetical protein